MTKVKDSRSYFKQSEKRMIQCQVFQRFYLQRILETSGNISAAELAIVGEQVKKLCQLRKHYNANI